MYFQELIENLNKFWAEKGAIIGYPYDLEKGAATFSPFTFIDVLKKKEWFVAFLEPCRRPADGRYGQNPNRLQKYYQYQVIIKPIPDNSLNLYVESLKYLGVDIENNELKFVEDDWESPTLGAWGLGWEVWFNGMEITQFTYFQQIGSTDLKIPALEITYGLERIAMILQNVDSVFDIKWNEKFTYGELVKQAEEEFSKYNFEFVNTAKLMQDFEYYRQEFEKLLSEKLLYPAYECVMRASNTFNLLDSRGALSANERARYINNIKRMAASIANFILEEEQ